MPPEPQPPQVQPAAQPPLRRVSVLITETDLQDMQTHFAEGRQAIVTVHPPPADARSVIPRRVPPAPGGARKAESVSSPAGGAASGCAGDRAIGRSLTRSLQRLTTGPSDLVVRRHPHETQEG